MADNDNRYKLWQTISKEYDLPDYNQFSKDMEDATKRKSLHDAVSAEYDLPDFDQFSKDMGYETQTTQQGNQNAQNAKKPQQTAQSSHVEEGRGLPSDNGYSKQKTAFDKAAEQAWNKLAHQGKVKWTIEGHPEVKMVAVTDDLVKKFPQLEQSRGYQVPFNMSTGTPIMQNIDDKGNIITPDEASEQYTKILTNQDFDYVPKQETASVQIGSVVNTALSTKGGWLDRAVQKAMEESYGKDWKNRKYVSDGKEISSSEIYAKAKQGIYDNINGVLGDIRKSLLFSTDEQRRQTVDELYQKGYLKEDFLPKANVLHYISNVDKGEQVEELRQRRLKLQVQRKMVMDKLNQIPQPDHAENMAEFYARRANDGSELYASDLRKIDKQIAQYNAVIDELEGRNNLKNEWGHAVQTSGITGIGAWDFGATDLKDAMMMYPLAKKMQNGENITQDDFMSLKLLAQANEADAVENSVMPSSYNMFKGSLQSVPFTVQFLAGGEFAKGATTVIDKAATRTVKGAILKAGGKKALKAAEKVAEKAADSKIIKFCGMLGKDFRQAFLMENTTGAATTGAEILNRHIGTVTESDDGFKMEGESLPTAIIKGEISQNIESQTEFLGEHFPSSLKFIRGMAHTKVGSAMGLRNLAAWLTNVSRTEFATTLKSYATRAGINGVLGEYLEEVAGTAENALLVGDQKFSDLLDVKQQEEVAGSVVLSCLGMGIFGTAIYTGQRGLNMPTYYRLKHLQNKWDNAGLDLFTGDEWAKLKERIDNTPNEGMKSVMADILKADNMTEEQARAAFNYARCLLTLRGMNLGAMKAAQLGLTDDRHIEQDNAYVDGRQAKDEDKHDIQIEFEDRSHELAERLGISEQQLDNMSDEDLESLTGRDDQLDNLIYDYQTSHAKYQGVVDNADDEIDKAAQEAARQTDMATDKSRGTVRNATIKATKGEEDYGVYIVSGNVATNEDGSINVPESDDMILYYDPKSGKIEHCDAMRLKALGEEVNAEETRNQAIADAKDKAIRKQAGIIDGTVGEGTSFTITDAEGNEHTYEVLADNGDGSAMITMDGNVQDTPVSLQDLQNLKDAEEAKRLEAAKIQRQQYEEEREKQNAPVEDNLDYADIINTNGNVEIAEVVDEEGNAMFPDAEEVFFVQNQGNRAKVMVLDSEGNLQPKLVKKSSVRTLGTMSVDEYRQERQKTLKKAENASEPSLVDETEPSNNVVPTGNITTDNTTTDETQPGNEAEVTTSDETQNISNEQENTPKITLEDGTEVPMLEDGNPDFSQLTAEQVAELYDSQFGEDAGQIITNNVNRSKKALDKANAMTVSGGSFVEQKASKDAKDKAIAEAQAKYDSAKAIEDAYNERMLAKEEDTPEGRMNLIEKARRKFNRMKGSVKDNAQAIAQLYDETVGSLLHRLYDSTGIDVFDDTANTVDEYVASSIAPYSLNYEGTETSKSVKQETGLSRSDFAKTGLLAKEGKGKTIGQLANDLWRDRPANLENITDQDVRNAIIDLITSGQTAFGLKNHIQNLRIAEAENILEQQKRQADELAHAEKQKEEEQASTEQADDNTEESSNIEATPADAQEEDKLADMPFEAPSPDEDVPFSAKDKAKDPLEVWNNMTDEEKAAYIENNRVKDTRLVDDVVGKKLRKAIEKIAEMMGATIQWQRTDMIRNGWFNPTTKTVYLALDSSILEGVQFVFGHEMTHDIKTKSPAMYDELKNLVKEKYGEELFEAMTNDNEKRYADVGKTDDDRSYYEEETVADTIGDMINDLNLTRSIALKMSHPLLAKMHDVLLKIKNAFTGTPYSDNVNGIIRTIEMAYVKTANREAVNTATQEGEGGQRLSFSLRLQDAINETDTEPTEAQKKSGNYKKGHVKFGGYDYTIENPKGSYRSGVDENGKEWKQKMNDTYGYIRGKFGKDGDHLDMFINDNADLDSWNGDVFVIDQVNQDGTFDEHKVMYGYDSLDEAKKAYLSNYEKGWTGLGNITPVSKAGFDKWLDKSNRKLKQFADYADITSKTNMDTAPSSFEEFLEHPAVRYSIRNEKERAAAEDAYNFAQENRPDRYSRYAIVNMEKPGAVPQYLEKKAVADNWRRYYNKLKWGNYKLFDLDKPFEDNVKNLVGKFPETFRKKNDTTLSKINELTADYTKRKEEYDAMSNSIQELLNGLMKQGRSLAEAESVIRDWGLYKEMDSKYQNLMGIRKQLNELRSGKVADDERFSLIGKKGAEALDHAEEVRTRLDNLNVARQMEEAKKDVKAIKMATGWERGADGKWRYEIADSKLNDMMDVDGKGKMVKRHKEDMLWTSGKLGEVVVAPELFKAYPKLKDVRLETDSIMNNLPSNGEYNAKTNTITIHADELKYLNSILNHEIQHVIQDLEGFAQGGDSKHVRKVLERLINENQEASDYAKDKLKEWVTLTMAADRLSDLYKQYINSDNEWLKNKAIESYWNAMNELDNNEQSTLTNDYPDGTAREIAESGYHVDEAEKELRRLAKETKESIPEGNNSALDLVSKLTDALENNDDYNLYRKLGGEVEARNVQSRMGMSPEERRKTLAEETEDVARKDQIFLYGDSVSMMGSRAFNEAINSGDNIRFSLKSMMEKPEGWKQANKKAIHIAEAIERDPKFSLKNLDGTLIKAGTYFSGGGLVEEGLKGIIDPVVAVEYDEKISGVYRNNFGNHIVTADVRDVDPKELVGKIDGEVEYFHASPVCKNYSLAKNNHEELELDKETAASTAEFISKVRPKVVTIENVKGYKDSEAMKTITDALDEAGYKWDADVYNAADYGGYTNRERLIVRAVRDGELPAKPEKQKRKSGWYEAVEDIMPTLTEKKNGVAPWMDERLKADGIDWRHIDKPLYVMGSGYANGTVPHAFADELLPTLRTKSGDVIVMPDGKVYRAMGRVLARVSGVSDDYQMPASEALSHTIIGNGIPTQLTENVIAPLVRDVLHPAVEERASLKDFDRKQAQLDIILKTNPMLDDYHTGIRKVEDIKTLGESVEEARSEAEKYGDDEWSAYPDIPNDMLQNALETGEITIYSSKPIKNGVFVTPSYMQASDYAGGGNVYEKTVPLTDVAWINTDEGQYAKVDGERYSLRVDRYRDELNQWKKDNNLPKDAERPQLPVREPNESAADFLKRVKEYRKQAALWATAPTYEDHLLVSDTAQGQFNLEMQRKAVLTRIVIQDSMLAIRKAQEAIMKEKGVDKLNPAEDAYTAENRSHGKAKNEFEEYNDEFLQPLRKAYNELMQRLGKSYDNVKVYMIAKHGLERNAYIAFKYALDEDYETNEERMNAYNNYKADMDRLNNDADFEAGRIDFAAWKQRDGFIRTKYAPSYFKFRFDENGMTKDYSGLSALFDADDYEGAAADLVKEVEDANPYYTDELWYATNDATKKILRDSYNAGMMTEDNFNFVSGMYRNYIPLRGWGDTNADQVWNYVGGGKGAFNQVVKEAKGRKSLADDPIAYIENMAESAILMNNRNWVKQHLLLLAQNHRTSLLNVSKAWYIKTKDAQGNEEWIPASPQITEGMTGKQVEAALDAFEQKMEQMQQNGEATQKREHLEISYPQTNGEEREHEVRVMKGGEEYVIYVNGDPQLAQAVNNTRARKVRKGIEESRPQRILARTGRYMAAAYTSMSPLFIPSNYMRDLTMTLASTAIREDARYNYLLRRNMLRHWNTFPMVLSYQNGTLREKVRNGSASRVEQMFYDFMMNGGETGFVTSVDVEDLKKKFKNDLKDLNRMAANPKKVGHIIMNSIETLNRAIEDSNRFMVYMTSIEYGRSIEEAVNNAKDVTLNFNRKGTGEHGWQAVRDMYLFINPAVQSLQTLGALAKHHPFKFTAVTTGWLATGLLVPMLNNLLMSFFGGDDDKDKYWQFTKWDRRNNFIMWIPFTKEFVKIPLAQEFRGFYGVGDMIASKLWGGEKAEESWGDYALDLAGQIVDMLPLDPTGYDGNIGLAITPNAARPIGELALNVDFTGKPIFRNSEYNKYDPNFTKAYVGTPDWLVRISKMVNSIDNKYPDVEQNAIDRFGDPKFNPNNPAVIDHLLSSYLGGSYTMGSQIIGAATKALNGDDIKMADIPLASKFVSNPDDRPVSKKQGEEFWDMKERHDRAANTLSKLKKKAKVDGDYSALDIFFGSDEYKQYKEDDKKVKKYEEDRKKEKAQETGEEYRPHKTTADDVYKSHTTPKDDFEDMKMKQLYEKLNSYKIRYEAIDGISNEKGNAYYKANKAAIDAIEEIEYDKSQIASIKKGFLSDGQNTYDADGMKDIRELRKRILDVLEKANKAMMNNRK